MSTIAIVVTHNQHEQTDRCIKSLVNQDGGGPAIIVVDDASDPPFESSDVEMQIALPSNMGVQMARNVGFRAAIDRCVGLTSDDLILFSDGDIVYEPHYLKALESSLIVGDLNGGFNPGYAYCNYNRVGVGEDKPWVAGEFSDKALRRANFISMMSLIRIGCLPSKPFIEDEWRLQDWSLWLRLLNAGWRGVWVDEALFTAYYDENSTSLRNSQDYQKAHRLIDARYNKGRALQERLRKQI